MKIPFARALAEKIPPAATRLRRDFGAHPGSDPLPRAPTPGDQGAGREGRTIASIEDYAVGARAGRRPDLRRRRSHGQPRDPRDRAGGRAAGTRPRGWGSPEPPSPPSSTSIGARSADGCARPSTAATCATSRRSEASRIGCCAGDPLPDEQVILPEPGGLHGCTVAETPPPDDRELEEFEQRLEEKRRGLR